MMFLIICNFIEINVFLSSILLPPIVFILRMSAISFRASISFSTIIYLISSLLKTIASKVEDGFCVVSPRHAIYSFSP